MWDGQVKVITGIQRCGKSYLLRTIFRNYLLEQGVSEDHILTYELDLAKDIRFRNPLELAKVVREKEERKADQYYLFVDEIQMSDEVPNPYNPNGKAITFYDALNDLKSLSNLDIYVTGSNSRMLSSDILTEFRGRSDEIRVHPLSFAEYYAYVGGDKAEAFDNYAFYGGLPLILSRPDDTSKMNYLKTLFSEVYLKDIVERKRIKREGVLSATLDLLCSSIGSLTNPNNIASSLKALKEYTVCWNTFTTGIPRTYSVPALLITSWAAWYSAMSPAFFPPIIVAMATTDTTAASRQEAPIRQSKTNIRTSMAINMATVPTMSARLWASKVSVSEAAPSRRFRRSPEALESK